MPFLTGRLGRGGGSHGTLWGQRRRRRRRPRRQGRQGLRTDFFTLRQQGGKASGAWAPHAQQEGWGQPSSGWPQNFQPQNWGPQALAWSRPNNGWNQPAPYGKGGQGSGKGSQNYSPYSGQESRTRRNGHGVWQSLQDVTAAARVAFDTARELRFLGTPAPAPALGQSPVTDPNEVGGSWLNTARSWLLGGPPDQQLSPPPPLPSGPTGLLRGVDYTALLAKFLTADGPRRQEQGPQGQEMARLTAELARQRELFALLVDRVALAPAARQAVARPEPAQAAARPELALQGPGEVVGRDAVNDPLLNELFLLKAAVAPAAGRSALPNPDEDAGEADGTGGAQLLLARLAPPLTAFDPEGDVTQAGAESFWAWLDATPRTPWIAKAPYGDWATKVQYKCSTAELGIFLARAVPERLEADLAVRRTKRDLVDALARACAEAARARASSGPSGGVPTRSASVLASLLRVPGASQESI